MPQTLPQIKNPWAAQTGPDTAGLEAQRSDLFTVDFSLPLAAIRGILAQARNRIDTQQIAGSLLQQFPTPDEMPYYANSIEFPTTQITASASKRHEVPILRPGLEEAVGSFTITFTQDTRADSTYSKVLAFLRAWRAVVRAGRDGQTEGELSLDLLQAGGGNTLIPQCKHNFSVQLWRGHIPQLFDDDLTEDLDETSSTAGVELAGQWTIVRGWLVGFQQGQLRHSASGIMEIRATFQAEAIVEAFL